jgi:PKD repeat protein
VIWLLACTQQTGDTYAPGVSADAGPDVTVVVGEQAELSASGSTGWGFEWDFGDGTQDSGERVWHAWDAPGLYTAVLQVTGSNGIRTDSTRVSVHLPVADTPAQRSGMMAVDADGAPWVVWPEADVVLQHTASGWVSHAVCDEPTAIAIWDGRVAVACRTQVQELDGPTWDAEPASRLQAIVAGDEGWYVTDPSFGVVRGFGGDTTPSQPAPGAHALAATPDGTLVTAEWRAPDDGPTVTTLGGQSWVLQVDTTPDSDTTTGGVPNLIEQLVVSPDGGWVYVPAMHANSRRGTVLSGQDLSHETAVVAITAVVELGQGEELTRRKQYDDKGRAIAAALSPEGNLLYVLHPGTQSVSVLDVWSGNLAGSVQGVGQGARDLRVVGDSLVIYAWLDRTVHVVDRGTLTVTDTWPLPGELEPLDAQVLRGKQLFWDSLDVRITRDGYISCANCHPDGRDDGRTWDFTNRGEGLRNTPSLEGRAGTAMGRVHWSGNFDEIQDFENDMRGHFAGLGFLSDEDWAAAGDPLGEPKAGRSDELDALARYVETLDQTPVAPTSAGDVAALETYGCAVCHPAPLYTDSTLDDPLRHDVGTLTETSGGRLGGPLDGLDTPTLLGSWDTAPYLHDGSAPDLETAIAAHNPSLTNAQVSELAQIVRGL